MTKVDGTPPMINFAQTILAGKTAEEALTTLQNALKSAWSTRSCTVMCASKRES